MYGRLIFALAIAVCFPASQAEASNLQQGNKLLEMGLNVAVPSKLTVSQAEEEVQAIILELGLTDEQITQLYQVDRQYTPQLEELYPLWEQLQEELEASIRSENASESEVRELYSEFLLVDRQLSELQFERRMAIRDILRPEQRLPYEQYIDQRVSESGL